MLIEAPLRKSTEVEALVSAGADLFYCGVLSDSKINNRHNSILHQFENFEDLKIAVKKAHYFGKRIFLTLNGMKVDMENCKKQIFNATEINVDGFIITDVALANEILKVDKESTIYLSVLVSAFNAESIKFYLQPGIKGLCLPRNISKENISKIISNLPKLEIATFVSGNCSNTQTICKMHNICNRVPIYLHEGGQGELVCEGWNSNTSVIETEITNFLNRKDWCPLCTLKKFKLAGVSNLKIEGRSLDTLDKVLKIKYIKSALDKLENLSDKEYVKFCKQLYLDKYGIKCNMQNCYYD